MTILRSTQIALMLAAFTSLAHAEEAPEIKAARGSGAVITDGKGHYIVFSNSDPVSDFTGERRSTLWYGDAKGFYRQPIKASAKNDEDGHLWSILDGRMGLSLGNSQLALKDGAYSMKCGPSTRSFTRVPDAEARALVAKAPFKGMLFNREAIALGRDGTTYYYIDHAREPEGNQDYRAYVGKRGAMKLLKTKALAADNLGVVITTASGSLRATRSIRDQVRTVTIGWVTRNKAVELTQLPVDANPELVYTDLGTYGGKRFGLPCDDR